MLQNNNKNNKNNNKNNNDNNNNNNNSNTIARALRHITIPTGNINEGFVVDDGGAKQSTVEIRIEEGMFQYPLAIANLSCVVRIIRTRVL